MLDLLLLFFLVVFIANKLFGILGQVDSDTANKTRGHRAWMADLLRRAQETHGPNSAPAQTDDSNMKELIDVAVISPMEAMLTSSARGNLKLLQEVEPNFDLEKFAIGVRKVFVMIIEAICAQNQETLHHLLDDKLYQELSTYIEKMKKDGNTLKQHVVTIRKVDIEDIAVSKLKNQKVALIDVAIVNQQTRVVYDANGKVIEGQEEKVELITSHWSFTRNIGTGDVVWLLKKM